MSATYDASPWRSQSGRRSAVARSSVQRVGQLDGGVRGQRARQQRRHRFHDAAVADQPVETPGAVAGARLVARQVVGIDELQPAGRRQTEQVAGALPGPVAQFRRTASDRTARSPANRSSVSHDRAMRPGSAREAVARDQPARPGRDCRGRRAGRQRPATAASRARRRRACDRDNRRPPAAPG